MDKYARQSHKTNQRARRRNNTAQYLLDNQLRQLDRERRCEQVTYQRNLDRVKTELSNLEGISSDFDLPLHDGHTVKKKADEKFPEIIKDCSTSGMTSEYDDSVSRGKCEDAPGTIGVMSSLYKRQSIDNNYKTDDETNYSDIQCLASSTPNETFQEDALYSKRPWSQTCGNKSKLMTCQYHSKSRLHHSCNYFPCRIPETYHALGFRRDDLCPRSDDELSTTQHLNMNSNENNLELTSGRQISDFTKNVNILSGCKQNNDNKTAFNTKWIKTNQGLKSEFMPTAHGPVFGYRPADPVLERIRQNRKEPKLNAVRPCARVTIRDRIRGVKQLVKEMKMSNEKVKPEDWATNYGKRVPTRILLNPVVPV